MATTPKETSDRAKTSKCVRLNDKKGLVTKFKKTKFPNELSREFYFFCVKYVEQLARGCSPTSVVTKKRFQKFRKDSEGLERKALPEDYQSFSPAMKRKTARRLVDKIYNELAPVMSHRPDQGVDTQEDFPDDMQMGEGSGPNPDSEGVAPDDSLQNVPLGSVPSEGSPRVSPGSTLGLGRCTLSQPDNPEGRPPPSSRQCLDELNHLMSVVEFRASRYPDMLPAFDSLKQLFILCVNKLKDRERNERLSLESRSNLRRGSLQDEDVFLRHQSISEGLEAESSMTGRHRENVGDIFPQVYGGSADGDLRSKPIRHQSMEDVDMQVNNPGQIQVDEVGAAALNPDLGNTLSNDASLQAVAWNQRENPEGLPTSRPTVSQVLHDFIWSDIYCRSLGFPETFEECQALRKTYWSLLSKLNICEENPEVQSSSRPTVLQALHDHIWKDIYCQSLGSPETRKEFQVLQEEYRSLLSRLDICEGCFFKKDVKH